MRAEVGQETELDQHLSVLESNITATTNDLEAVQAEAAADNGDRLNVSWDLVN